MIGQNQSGGLDKSEAFYHCCFTVGTYSSMYATRHGLAFVINHTSKQQTKHCFHCTEIINSSYEKNDISKGCTRDNWEIHALGIIFLPLRILSLFFTDWGHPNLQT